MAVENKNISAKLRMTDTEDKTVTTLSGIAAEATPDDLIKFTLAVSAMRNEPIGAIYLVAESELTKTA